MCSARPVAAENPQATAQRTREALRLVTLDLAAVLVQVEVVLAKIRQLEAA